MVAIIEQIQRDAVDDQVRISTLLRKVKLAAAKLGLGTIEDWVESELNGYDGRVPDYRIVYGRPMFQNPVRGWEPSAVISNRYPGAQLEARSLRSSK
jgi:hypothetical protein